jgi:hypothetical protein
VLPACARGNDLERSDVSAPGIHAAALSLAGRHGAHESLEEAIERGGSGGRAQWVSETKEWVKGHGRADGTFGAFEMEWLLETWGPDCPSTRRRARWYDVPDADEG